MKLKKEFSLIPNWITLFRLLSIPILLFLAYNKYKIEFGILLTFSALSDAADGILARVLNQSSKFGAKFDSFTDDIGATFLVANAYFLFPELVPKYFIYVLITGLLLVFTYFFRIFKAKNIGLHIYSHKFSAWLSIVFFLYIIFLGFNEAFFWFFIFVTYFANIELILIIIFKKNVNENTKSLFF